MPNWPTFGAPIPNVTILCGPARPGCGALPAPGSAGLGLWRAYANWIAAVLSCGGLLVAATYAHHAACGRIQQFAAQENLQVKRWCAAFAAILWHWMGWYERRAESTKCAWI